MLPGTDCLIKSQVPLSALTSFRVGGPAEWYIAPRELTELEASLSWANSEGLPITFLGAGSNLLVSDDGLPGLVICTRHLRQTSFDREKGQVTVGSGASIARLAWKAAEQGWTGLEWAVGIPGTVGGVVAMNAGAHNTCVADILVSVMVLAPDGQQISLPPDALDYHYRSSAFQKHLSSYVVTGATFQLQPGADPAQVLAETSQHLEQRRLSQPYHLPSCGSVFRNPNPNLGGLEADQSMKSTTGQMKAGWLIEQTGLKGYQIGKAQVAQRHANFILNCGGAKASDIYQLIHYVQEQVATRWELYLQPEVKMLGNF